MTVQLALRKNDTDIGSRLIRWWTGSPYSHCELVVDGFCYSSSLMDHGVRRKAVGLGSDDVSLSPDKWDLVELPWANKDAILAYFAQTDGYGYGWFSLIASQIINRNIAQKNSQFCSEWSATALGLPDPSTLSPGGLGDTCRFLCNFGMPAVPA